MADAVRTYIRIVESMNRLIGRVVMYGIFAMMAILLYSTTMKAVSIPPLWTLEMAQFAMVAYYMLGGPYSMQTGDHVRMDLFYSRWSQRRRTAVDAVTVLFLIFYLAVLLWGGIDSTIYAFQYGGERSPTAWRPYLWPIKVIMCVGIVLMLLQAIAEFLKDVFRLRSDGVADVL